MGVFLMSTCILLQTGISGPALLTWSEQGTTCGEVGKIVHIFADVRGLTGQGGAEVGLNSFVLTVKFDRSDVFASAFAGEDVGLSWGFKISDEALIILTNTVTLVGWMANADAPNQNYHLATLVLAGSEGPVTLTLQSADLGSRVANGDGPGPVPWTLPAPIIVTLPGHYYPTLIEGGSLWRTDNTTYDINSLPGVDVADLVEVINCGG